MPDAAMSRSEADLLKPSANQRFREAWRAYLHRATAFAVGAHVALLALSFTWQISYSPLEFLRADENSLALLPGFGEAPSPGSGTTVADSLPGELTQVDGDSEAGLTEGPVVDAADVGDRWEALGRRLQGGGALRPALAEPEMDPPEVLVPTTAETSSDGTSVEEGAPVIGGSARTAELADLPEPDSLSLDRLSALRPELAFMTASAWVLIRNQAEVEAYLARGYRTGRLDRGATGSVSVTLWIDRRGSVEWAEVSQSSGRIDLDEFTLALFNEVATFRAAREQGVYVSRSVTFSVNYPW
jgi:TonB family protein